ncbi:MAG: hypothetical protein M3R31_08700 [Pseudomonadota bacterium]|nr:hypothetical protein [Pseudomonadota bacterium]
MSGRGKAQKTIALIYAARRILEEIQPASVRAVCYRLFVAGVIPSTEQYVASFPSISMPAHKYDGPAS